MKSSFGAVGTQNGPLLPFTGYDDLLTVPIKKVIVGNRHPLSREEEGLKGTFHLPVSDVFKK